MEIKKYSIEWKNEKHKKYGGWAQRHDQIGWKWHYIRNETEYSHGAYRTKKECEEREMIETATETE